MAAEADVPESISVTTEAGDGYVSTGKFDITVDQCSPLQLKKSEGQEDQHPEPAKCFVEGETAHVESKNGVSECGNPLEPLLDPKVDKQEICVAETPQGDESNQVETGIPDRENGEKGSVEKEAVEATEKKSEHVESNGIVNAEAAEASRSKTNLDEHVQVISDQQDSGTGKSFAMVYEEKGPEVTSETKESAEDKLESASVLDDHEEKAGLGKEIQEKNIPDTPLPTKTEDIIEESPKEVKNQYETFEETPEASGTASEAVKEDENAECQVESPCMKREEGTLKKGETLDTGEASVVEEEVLNVSTVKCDEGDQGDGTNPTKDDKDVDTFTAKVVEDDDYTSAVTITVMSAKVTPNDEESSPQTLQKCDSGEELQHLRDVMPEETKTETSRENAEEITCTKEETTTQNTQEYLDEEKKEATENTNNLEDDNARDEVLDTAGAEQETGEHVVREIHTLAEPPQDFVDKETNEETSTEYQACIEAADLSINTAEKNLQEQAISELSSPLVVEETAKEIPKDEETDVLIPKEEKKEEDAECNEPAEVKSMTLEALPETTEDITEPNKDLNAPISEESNKTFVENISSLAEVSETETEKNIQEKDGLAVSNSDSVSGEVSHVTGLKEAETENEEQKDNIDTAPEEKAQATILKDETASEVEDIGVQAEENCESKEKLEEHIPTAADEGKTLSKEAEAEKEEQIKCSDIAAEEKGANILTDETPLEDTDVQAEKNVKPIENLDEQIPIRADEGETFLKEAEAESKDEIKNTDGSHEDVDGQGEKVVNSEENLDKQIPTGDCETSLKEAEAEKEEQGKSTDIVPEEKGPETILTDATSLDVEDIQVKAKDYVESKENEEEQIPIAADEEKTTYISLEDIDVQAEENFITRENLENQILTTPDEQETGSEETKTEIKAEVKSIDIVPEKKGLETISTAETPLVVEDIGVKSEESFKSKENVEEQIPTAADEGGKFLKEAEAENKEQIEEENLNSQESSDKEKEEVTEITHTKEDDTVLETTSTEQETGEHVVYEIHTVAKPPQDSIDKETNEENSVELQACTDAADLSTTAEEKNLEEHAIQELSSPLVVEEATNEIPKEEETYTTLTTLLEEEEKERHATCNEATEEYAAETEKNIQEKDGATPSNSESVSGELSHVTILKESETKIEMQDKDMDTVPEERGQATILANETASEVKDIDVQLKENFESKGNLEEQFPIAADEGEIFLKEPEAENKEQIKNADIAHEDVDVQAEKTVNSEEDIDKQIPPIADEDETSLKEAEAEIKEQVAYADIVPEDKGLAAILTDETPLEAEDTGVQAEESFESKEKFKEKNPIATDEDETFLKEAEAENKEQIKYSEIAPEDKGLATILTDEKASNIDGIGLQAEETFNPSKNLESKIPSTADEHETSLKEAEAVNTEQVKYTDIAPEESKTESSSKKAEVVTCTKEEETTPMNDTKEIETEVEEVFEIASMEQETGEHATREIHTVEDNAQEVHDKETTVENLNEHQVSSEAADSSTDFVGNNSDEQASRELSSSLVGDDTSNESSKQEENYISSLKEEENEVNVECKEPVEGANTTHETKFETLEDSIEPKEDLYAHISEEETHTEESSKVVNSLQSEVSEKDVCTDLEGAEAETKEQVKDIEIDHEEKGLTTILTDGAALENVNSEVFPENQIPRVANEGGCNTELAGDKAAEESLQVRRLEEAEPKLRVEDESRESEDHPKNKNMIVEEPQLLEQVLDEPNSADGDFSKGQTTEGNASICAPEIIQEETAKNSQDSDKETENLQKDGSGIQSVKAYNTTDLSREFTPEDGSKKFNDNKQDTVKFEGEILKEPEIDGVGESTTYETNQIVETSEEILDASPVKYEEGQPGEGSSQDSAKASKEEDVSEVDDRNGAVTSAVVTSKEEEDSAEASEKYEPEEEKVPVKISDVADAKEVCDLEDKASFAQKTTEETSLQKEGHSEVSELAPEKLDVDATEEEFKESSEIVPESDSRSIDVVSKDEIVTSQTLDKGILQEQVEIPSCTLLTEEKEIEASQHEHETPTKDKNIEEEAEKEVPADGNVGDLFAGRSEDKTPLQKEESEELKASELALEKLVAGDTEKEIKETFKTISISDSQSTDAVSKDETVADQTHLEASYALLPKEEELRTYQDDRETTTQEKSIEEEYAKETEVPADENGRDLVAATFAEETLLQKEEPRELKVSELALKNLDAGETEETKERFEKVSKSDSQSAEVVSGDETTEMKISQCVHETTTQDKNKEDESTEKNDVPDGNTRGIFFAATSEEETRLQMEEPREFKACELAPERLDAGETEEEIKETLETISKSDSQSIDTVSKDNIVADQTLVEASYTSLPEEKEYKAGESEVPAAENGGDLISARSVEETILKKEEPGELKVSELAPEELNAGKTEEEIKKTPETVSEPDFPSTDMVSRDEALSDQTLHEGISTEKLQIPSSILLPEEKEIKASEEHRTTFCDKNIEENASNLQMQVDENVKATSMEEETSLLKEEPRQLKASDFELQLKAEVPGKSSNEEIKEDEKLPEESEPYSVREESHDENKAKAEKQGEQIDETSTIKTNEHQNELSEVDEKGIASYKYERQLTFEGLSIKENDPHFIEDKTTHDGFPEEEKRVEEADFEFGLKNQGDEINSKSSITSTQMEKDSSTEVSCKAPIVETSQGIESNECGKVISTESGTVSLPNLVPESTKETATACKELKTEEDDEEEHEISEQVKTDEEKGENELKNREAGYESPIMVEASRDADVNVKVVSHKKSNNILSGIKHSMSKVKKAIIGKSSHPKTHSEK